MTCRLEAYTTNKMPIQSIGNSIRSDLSDANDTLWYQDGLRFECTQCGNCCTGEPGFVWVDDAEIAALAERLEIPIEEMVGFYTKPLHGKRSLREKANGDCVFFKEGEGCTVYELRPRQCRTWPFWESNLVNRRAWDRMKQGCPGAGHGELIPVEEITKRMKVIRI